MGKIIIKKNPPETELDALKVKKWPTWEKEVSEFDWVFPEQEMAYILEGECLVTPLDEQKKPGVTIKFGKGDLVVFPAGLSTRWEVIKPLQKHYKLDGNALTQAFRRIKLKFTS